jgi:hypothetical protein
MSKAVSKVVSKAAVLAAHHEHRLQLPLRQLPFEGDLLPLLLNDPCSLLPTGRWQRCLGPVARWRWWHSSLRRRHRRRGWRLSSALAVLPLQARRRPPKLGDGHHQHFHHHPSQS